MSCSLRNLKSVVLVGLLLVFAKSAIAQDPNWSVDATQFSNSMNVIGFIKVDGVESEDENDKVGAFIDGELRGVASTSYVSEVERFVVFLTVFSNEASGEISFKVYDASEDALFDATATAEFEPGGFVGGIDESFTWSNVDLRTEALMESFQIASQLGATDIDGFNINIEASISAEDELTSQIATWAVSEGASVKFNNEVQISGESNYDFSSTQVFQVQSEDLLTVNDYTITVTVVNQSPQDLGLDNLSIVENSSANSFIGSLSTIDNDEGDTHFYSLADGEGADDNDAFKVSGNSLIASTSFDHETASVRKIRLATTDSYGESFEKAFEIEIQDVNEAPTGLEFSNSVVNENEAQVTVGTISAIDADEGDFFTFMLSDGSGLNDNDLFDLQGQKLILNRSVNFEEQENLEVNIKVTDAQGLEFSNSYLIAVNDMNDAPEVNGEMDDLTVIVNSSESFTHMEDLITDEDANDQISYRLSLSDGSDLPDWIAYDAQARSITTEPTIDHLGEVNLLLIGEDNAGERAEVPFTLTINVVAAVEKISNASDLINIHPNPAREKIFMNTEVFNGRPYNFQIIKISSGELLKKAENVTGDRLILDVGAFVSGGYLIEVYNEKKVARKKFMIVR